MAQEGRDTSVLDEMLDKLGSRYPDYVFVFNTDQFQELGGTYKGRKIRRFKMIEKNSGYLMPDPMITDEQILELYGSRG